MANDEQDDGGAAQAFAELRAEVTVMRRAIESLPTIIKGLASPDYSPSFGAVGKVLANVDARLAGIEGHPALKMTPAQHGDAIERAGAPKFREPTASAKMLAPASRMALPCCAGVILSAGWPSIPASRASTLARVFPTAPNDGE